MQRPGVTPMASEQFGSGSRTPTTEAVGLEQGDTRAALARYVRGSPVALVIGLAPLALAATIGWSVGVIISVGLISTSALPGGLWGIVRAVRMRRLLGRQPWSEHRGRYVEQPDGDDGMVARLVLLDERDQPHVLSVSTWLWRLSALEACNGKTVWFLGSLRRGGVAAAPGADRLFWAHRSVLQNDRSDRETIAKAFAKTSVVTSDQAMDQAIGPRPWIWAVILEATGFAVSFAVGLLVLDSFTVALGGCLVVMILFLLWIFLGNTQSIE